LRSPVVPKSKSQGYLGAVGSKVPTYTLADRLECCPAVSLLGDVVSHDLSGAVVNGCKEPAPALTLRIKAHPSVPQSSSGRSVQTVPLCVLSPRWWTRLTRARSLFSRMRRRARFLPTLIPFLRSMAQTFRCPSERNELASSMVLISSRNSASECVVVGPRFSSTRPSSAALPPHPSPPRPRTLERTVRKTEQIMVSG